MNRPFPTRQQVEFTRLSYPPGSRILLYQMTDPYAPVPSGTRGTVRHVDDAGQVGVAWDNGRSLPLIPGVDSFRKLTQQEIAQKQANPVSDLRNCLRHAGSSTFTLNSTNECGTSGDVLFSNCLRPYFFRHRFAKFAIKKRRALQNGVAFSAEKRHSSAHVERILRNSL